MSITKNYTSGKYTAPFLAIDDLVNEVAQEATKLGDLIESMVQTGSVTRENSLYVVKEFTMIVGIMDALKRSHELIGSKIASLPIEQGKQLIKELEELDRAR